MNLVDRRVVKHPVLETRRLVLRMFRPGDADALARIFADREVMRHMGAAGEPASHEETERALASIVAHWDRHGIGRWAVEHRASGQLVGYGGLRWFEHEGEESAPELVYLLDKDFWGDGLATEVAWASLEFGFAQRNFARVVALTKPANAASRHILGDKIGMRFVGAKKLYGLDVVQYALARSDYEPDPKRFRLARQSSDELEPPAAGHIE